MRFKSIADEWESAKKAFLHRVTSPWELRERKRMFYAGAVAVMSSLYEIQSEVSKKEAVDKLQEMNEEIITFMENVKKGID